MYSRQGPVDKSKCIICQSDTEEPLTHLTDKGLRCIVNSCVARKMPALESHLTEGSGDYQTPLWNDIAYSFVWMYTEDFCLHILVTKFCWFNLDCSVVQSNCSTKCWLHLLVQYVFAAHFFSVHYSVHLLLMCDCILSFFNEVQKCWRRYPLVWDVFYSLSVV